MITVNLLPKEFRVRKKSESKISLIKIAAGAGVLFLILSLFNYFDFLHASSRLKKIEKEWQRIQPEALALSKLHQEVEAAFKPERDFLASYVTTDEPLTYFLGWASEFLPPPAWLSQIRMERKGAEGTFFLAGQSLALKDKSSIEQIESYMNELKKKIPQAQLSLTTERKKIGETETTEFMATFNWGKNKP